MLSCSRCDSFFPLISFKRSSCYHADTNQGDEVWGGNTMVCTQKLCCKALELNQTFDFDVFVRTERTLSKLTFRESYQLQPGGFKLSTFRPVVHHFPTGSSSQFFQIRSIMYQKNTKTDHKYMI